MRFARTLYSRAVVKLTKYIQRFSALYWHKSILCFLLLSLKTT